VLNANLLPEQCLTTKHRGVLLVSGKILIVDDHDAVRSSLRSLLASRPGWTVCGEAKDGVEATEKAASLRPDVILMDVSMPKMDGVEATRIIRDADPGVAVIIISQNDPGLMQEAAVHVGARAFIQKSRLPYELMGALESLAETNGAANIPQAARDAKIAGSALLGLPESEERFRAIVETTPECVKLVATDGTVLHMNKPGLQMVGALRLEDVLGKSVYDLIAPEHLEKYRAFNERICSGEKDTLEFDIIGLTGIRRHMETHAAPLRNGDGRMVHLGITSDVTERKRAEQALRQQRERFDLATQASELGFWFCDLPFDTLVWDARVKEHFWLSPDADVSISTFYDRLHPDDRERTRQAIERCMADKSPYDIEYRTVAPDGRQKWIRAIGRTFYAASGTPLRFDGVTLDVTRHKEAERATSLLAAIVTSSDDAIVSKNLDGTITSWNKAAERIFGYTADEAIGRNITLIIPPDRHQEESEIISRLRRAERIDHFETVRVSKNGDLLNVSLTISPVKDSSGRVIGASKVARNITERKRAEERERQATAAIVATTAKFKAVFEQTTVFAGIMDLDGVLVETNRLSLDACGYRAEDEIGRPFWEGGWWGNFPESRDKIRAATPLVAQGICFRETLHYSWADGTPRLVDFALYPIVDDRGEVLFLHPTGVDVTDLKRNEEKSRKLTQSLDAEVRARTSELEKRNQDVSRQTDLLREFSQRLLRTQDEERRHIARELHDSAGQTLTVLSMSLAQLVQKASRLSPELAGDAEMIEETVRQLHREIRTTSYLLHPPLLDEAGLSSALNWYVRGLVERSGLDVSVAMAGNVGRLPREMELAIFRIVQECLTNIHRHSGSKTASIHIARQPENVTVEIRDAGNGMSTSKLAEIQAGRSGVGIRGMRERLRQFNGSLKIESDKAGTLITVTLPVESKAAQEAPPLQAAV
jgi:PAS domain S-box-containing protein